MTANVDRSKHRVYVRLVEHDRSALLALVSVLHRRGVEVTAAALRPADGGRQTFTATFLASATHARTVAATLGNRVDVLSVDLTVAPGLALVSS